MIFQLMDLQQCIASGFAELDAQQVEFAEKGNRYLRAYAAGTHSAMVEPMIIYLSDYTKKHFEVQEEFMRAHGYPGTDKHVAHHCEYIREIAKVFKMMMTFKSTSDMEAFATLSLNVGMIIVDWFDFHIAQADTRLNEFIQYEVRGKRRSQ
ncbi:MAG: hemerythrin family protein [Deferribacteraceae bacterium]|jgi:hemerythrin-like metal-binding protein|nr:hemerythrin family protein [Deferribacteraceae bacterium]